MKKHLTKILILATLMPATAFAQMSSFDVNGYVKYLFSTSKFPFVDERLNGMSIIPFPGIPSSVSSCSLI